MAGNKKMEDQFKAAAEEKYDEAEKILQSCESSKLKYAAQCYEEAAAKFEMARKWYSAGRSWCDAASMYTKLRNKTVAVSIYMNATRQFITIYIFLTVRY
jgi:hypothetical protein